MRTGNPDSTASDSNPGRTPDLAKEMAPLPDSLPESSDQSFPAGSHDSDAASLDALPEDVLGSHLFSYGRFGEVPSVDSSAGDSAAHTMESAAEGESADLPHLKNTQFVFSKLLAQGGMGEVWEGWQRSLGRTVAIKTIRGNKWHLATSNPKEQNRMVRAFASEAMVSAQLEHPNIVPVYDLGLAGPGQPPVLAMNLVRGETWENQLKKDFTEQPEEVLLAKHLPILVDVAQAVGFAHSRGFIHRDLKPDQVIIGPFGQTKLMDWGLAIRVFEPEDDPQSVGHQKWPFPDRTTGASPAGTPAMMPPEQTQATAADVGPWSDVYLLGGILYFILTAGRYPHCSASSHESFQHARDCEVEHPTLHAEGRLIPDELATLAMRALSRRPQDRPSSAQEFIDGLVEYLTGASRVRESQKLTAQARQELEILSNARAQDLVPEEAYERHAAVAELLGKALENWPRNVQARELRRRNLESRLDLALRNGDLLFARVHLNQLRNSIPTAEAEQYEKRLSVAVMRQRRIRQQRAVLITLVSLMGIFIVTVVSHFALELKKKNTALQEQVLLAGRNSSIARSQGERAFDLINFVLGDLKNALELDLSRAQGLSPEEVNRLSHNIAGRVANPVVKYFSSSNVSQWPPDLRIEFADRSLEVARRFNDLARHDEALAIATNTLSMVESTLGPGDPRAADCLAVMADALDRKGEYGDAESALMRALQIRSTALPVNDPAISATHQQLGGHYLEAGNYPLAEENFKTAMAGRLESPGGMSAEAAASLRGVAAVYRETARFSEARELVERALKVIKSTTGTESLEAADCLSDLATLALAEGKLEEALPWYEEAVKIRESQLGPDHPETLVGINNLALTLKKLHRLPEAEHYYKRALETAETSLGPNHHETSTYLNNLSLLYVDYKNYEAALPLARRSLEIKIRVFGPDHPRTAAGQNNVALILWSMGRTSEARGLYGQALATMLKSSGPDHPNTVAARINLGRVLMDDNQFEETARLYEEVLESREKTLGADHADTAWAASQLAEVYARLNRFEEAVALQRRALHVMDKLAGAADPDTIYMQSRLGGILLDRGQLGEAEKVLMEVQQVQKDLSPAGSPDLKETEERLERLRQAKEQALGGS